MSVIIPIDLGTVPNDGTGDPLRVGGQSINTNFANLNADKLESGGYGGTGQDLFTLLNNKVSKTGDTMTGDLIMQGVNIKSPTATLTLGSQNILYADITVNNAENLLAVGKTLNVTGQTKNTALFGLSNTLGNTQIIQNCIVGGELNTIDGTVDDSIISGEGNTHTALASFTIGEDNTNIGRFNVVSGLNNLINGDSNIISGNENNAIACNNNLIVGSSNGLGFLCNGNIIGGKDNQTFTPSSNNIMGGTNNQSILGSSFVIGEDNTANAKNLIIGGNNNNSTGDNSIVGGNNNSVSGTDNFVIGSYNLLVGENSIVSGLNNESLAFVGYVTMFGKGLQSQKDNEHIFGTYNAPTTDGLFTIGYGTNISRKNSFVATDLGHISLPAIENEYKNDADAFTNGGYVEQEVYSTYGGKLQISQKRTITTNNNVVGNMLSYSGSFINFGSDSGSVFPTDGDACQFGTTPASLGDHVGNLAISYDAYISKVSCKWSSADDFVTDVGTAVVSFKFYKCDINDDVSLPASWTLIHTLTTTWDNTSGSSPGFVEDVLPSNVIVDANTLIAFVAETTVNFAQNEEVEVTLILENR